MAHGKHWIVGLFAAAALTIAGGAGAADDSLTVFDWSGYEDPEFFKGYTEKHGDAPTFAYFGDEEEAFQKLRAGFKADLAHPCSQSVPKWREAGLIVPLDTSRIPTWDVVMKDFRDLPGFVHEGKHYILPIDWGSTQLTYRTDLVDAADAATLQSFADPKFQGRVSLPDNVDDAFALAFLATGVRDWTKATDEDFAKAAAFLRKAHQNVRAYWTDSSGLAQMMASGEVILAWAWNETTTTLVGEGHPVAMNKDAKEGMSTWVCGYSLLADHPGSIDKAYDFMNAWMEDRTAEYIITAWGYGHTNTAALAKMDPEVLKSSGFDNVDKYTANSLWQAPTSPALRERMIAEFEKIKAGF